MGRALPHTFTPSSPLHLREVCTYSAVSPFFCQGAKIEAPPEMLPRQQGDETSEGFSVLDRMSFDASISVD